MNPPFVQMLAAFAACLGYCVVFNIKKLKFFLFPSLGGALGWGVCLLLGSVVPNDLFRFFIVTVLIAVYAEVMARLFKTPATVFLLVGILPLVPGGGLFYTMEYCISGDNVKFLTTGLQTLGIAGSLAVGIILVSSTVRLWSTAKARRQKREQ